MFSYDELKKTDFLGIFNSLSDITGAVSAGNTAIVNNYLYIYESSWHKVTFLGVYIDHYSGDTPENYSLVCILPDLTIGSNPSYKIYKNGSWQNFNAYDVFNLILHVEE